MEKRLIVFIVLAVFAIIGSRLAMHYAPRARTGGAVVVQPASK